MTLAPAGADFVLAAFPAPNDGANRYDIQVPQVTWTGPAASNDTTGLLICYDNTGADADGVLMPISHHDFVVVADGNDVVLNLGDFMRSS